MLRLERAAQLKRSPLKFFANNRNFGSGVAATIDTVSGALSTAPSLTVKSTT